MILQNQNQSIKRIPWFSNEPALDKPPPKDEETLIIQMIVTVDLLSVICVTRENIRGVSIL